MSKQNRPKTCCIYCTWGCINKALVLLHHGGLLQHSHIGGLLIAAFKLLTFWDLEQENYNNNLAAQVLFS